jgi:F0F1-type ATP synthase assembly protein I
MHDRETILRFISAILCGVFIGCAFDNFLLGAGIIFAFLAWDK